jgi:hypothetical protein
MRQVYRCGLRLGQALCLELEDLGHASDFASAAGRLQTLEQEMPMVYAALEYCRDLGPDLDGKVKGGASIQL